MGRNERQFGRVRPGSPDFGKSRAAWSASTGKKLKAADSGCLMALVMLPVTALLSLLRREQRG